MKDSINSIIFNIFLWMSVVINDENGKITSIHDINQFWQVISRNVLKMILFIQSFIIFNPS